jgi:cytochrome c biogenesis protein CcdA
LPQRVLNLKKKKSNAYFKTFFLSLAFAMGYRPSIGTLRGFPQAANQEILLKGFNMRDSLTLNNH